MRRTLKDRIAEARNPYTPLARVRELARDSVWAVRRLIALRDDLPSERAWVLAADSEEDVRCAIAERADLPAELARVLADDPVKAVRDTIARRHPTASAPGESR